MSRPRGKKLALLAGVAVVVLLLTVLASFQDDIQSWYVFWKQFDSLGKNEQGYLEYRHRQTGIVFVRVLGGVPSQQNSGNLADAKVEPFLMAKQKVTQKEWKEVTGNNPGKPKADDQPVTFVGWYDCQDFCEKTGLLVPAITQWDFVVVRRYGIVDMEPSGTGRIQSGPDLEWCRYSPDPGFVESIDFSQWRHATGLCTRPSSEHRPVRGRKAVYPEIVCQANEESRLNGFNPHFASSLIGFRPVYYPIP